MIRTPHLPNDVTKLLGDMAATIYAGPTEPSAEESVAAAVEIIHLVEKQVDVWLGEQHEADIDRANAAHAMAVRREKAKPREFIYRSQAGWFRRLTGRT
jgi:hypothetical protein